MARNNAPKIELTAYDDLFQTDESRAENRLEKIQIIPASEVFPYERQPYSVKRVTKDLIRLMDTVADGGQLTHYFVKLWVRLFAEPIAFYHSSQERFFGAA